MVPFIISKAVLSMIYTFFMFGLYVYISYIGFSVSYCFFVWFANNISNTLINMGH